jgi:uncharacterized Fe-S cluster-containing radical SAM superfamily protein
MNYPPECIVKSCRKLESGLRFGPEGIHACQVGPFSSPLFWSAEEASGLRITKEMIIEKRKELFQMLNSQGYDIPCKTCQMLITKRFDEVDFTKLGHIDLASSTICNLRCTYCGYTTQNWFIDAKYEALAILREFAPEEVVWDSAVDFNGGEPTLLKNFDEFVDFFASRRIRIFLYTNAVIYSQSVQDGLANGNIRWICTSLDCGTQSSFLRIKQRDQFHQVIENLKQYAVAGSQGGGSLAVKYIFCDSNCGDEDVLGFVETMRAVRPQKVWLTFDFEPLRGLTGNTDDFGELDYSHHIAAYAKMFLLLEENGIETEHFAKRHLAVVSRHGRVLLDKALAEIERNRPHRVSNLPNPGTSTEKSSNSIKANQFSISPLRLCPPEQDPLPWNIDGKRVAIAPACADAISLLADPELKKAEVVAFVDRDRVLHGKHIQGIPVHGYEEIGRLSPDVILIVAPETHRTAIFQTITQYAPKDACIAIRLASS